MGLPQKIMIVLGTRPEAIKLFPLIHAIGHDARFAGLVCSTRQHCDLLDGIFAVTGVVPDHVLPKLDGPRSLDALTGHLLSGVGAVLDTAHADAVVVQGDTASAFAGALAAYHRRIPVIHVEAGLRSGDRYHPWPEEGNRRMIASLATVHCTPTEAASDSLLAENITPSAICQTGNTVIDALHWMRGRLATESALAHPTVALRDRFGNRRIIAVTCHRRENWTAGVGGIADALQQLAARGDVGIVFPLHPNPAVAEPMRAALGAHPAIALVEPLDYPDFVALLDLCALVLTDSGGVQEEAPALGKPVLVLRETTERPEGVVAGTARLVGSSASRIVAEATRLLDDPAEYAAMARAHSPYGDGRAAGRILDRIAQI